MKQLLEKIQKTQQAKKELLKNVVQLVEPNKGTKVTLRMKSSDYKLRWHKNSILKLAKIYGAEVRLNYQKQIAIFEFETPAIAGWFRDGFKK